jgi:murein L,D-transpeptidase YafK
MWVFRFPLAKILARCAAVGGILALLFSCATAPPSPAPLPAPARPAERPGPWNTTYAVYNPALFGPERPLADLVAEYHLHLREGKIAGVRLLLNKAQRRLEVWVRRRMVKAYRLQLGQNPTGRKTRRGDQRTPEGRYFICSLSPSPYCLALWISYPNIDDARAGLHAGVISQEEYEGIAVALKRGECPPQETGLGGYLWLHGQLPEHTEETARKQRANAETLPPGLALGDIEPSTVREFYDWTQGCAAFFNPDIRELYEFIPRGTPITIVPNGPVTPPARR